MRASAAIDTALWMCCNGEGRREEEKYEYEERRGFSLDKDKPIANTISAEKIMYYSIAITAPSDDDYY